MNIFLNNISKLSILILILMVFSCEELPTSIEQSSNDGLKTDIVDNLINSNTKSKHFTITKDESNDRLYNFSINDNLNFKNQNDLQYRWDFDGDEKWDTEWMLEKNVNFLFDDYEVYSTKLSICDEKNILSEVVDRVAVEPACVDVDGNIYKIIKIGNQWWMAENLRVKQFRTREPVKEITDKTKWHNLNTAAYCYYNNDSNIEVEYGLLYNWKAVNDDRGIAPNGWHTPTDSEFQILENYLGSRSKAGGKMKESGTAHWYHPNNASNSSDFTALPGGCRDSNGDFAGFRGFGFLWTSTKSQNLGAWYRYMDHMYVELDRSYCSKRYGFSVRCVMNNY